MAPIFAALTRVAVYLFAAAPGAIVGHINWREFKRAILGSLGVTTVAGLVAAILGSVGTNASAIFPDFAFAGFVGSVCLMLARYFQGSRAMLPAGTMTATLDLGTISPDQLRAMAGKPTMINATDAFGLCPTCPEPSDGCDRCPKARAAGLDARPASLDELERMLRLVSVRNVRTVNPGHFYRWFVDSFFMPGGAVPEPYKPEANPEAKPEPEPIDIDPADVRPVEAPTS